MYYSEFDPNPRVTCTAHNVLKTIMYYSEFDPNPRVTCTAHNVLKTINSLNHPVLFP